MKLIIIFLSVISISITAQEQPFQFEKNNIGNILTSVSNSGISFQREGQDNVFIWPRDSKNYYMYGGGLWLASKKKVQLESGDYVLNKLVTMTYNPSTAKSMCVPGLIKSENSDKPKLGIDKNDSISYRIYNSLEFDTQNGEALVENSLTSWPIWLNENNKRVFQRDPLKRNLEEYPNGPSFEADEEIISMYKSSDIFYYGSGNLEGRKKLMEMGYPLELEFIEHTFFWENELMGDVMVKQYEIIYQGEDTLRDCFLAPVFDYDIVKYPMLYNDGDQNNNIEKKISCDSFEDMYIIWSESPHTEGFAYGYIGFSILDIPTDKISSYRNWSISDTSKSYSDLYDFISSGIIDSTTDRKYDIRSAYASGKFDFIPGEMIHLSYMLVLANNAKEDSETDGTCEDAKLVINKMKEAQEYFSTIDTYVIEEPIVEEEIIENEREYSTEKIMIVPNPFFNKTSIIFNSDEDKKERLIISDLNGIVIYDIKLEITEGLNKIAIDFSRLKVADGVYIYHITDTTHTGKLVYYRE